MLLHPKFLVDPPQIRPTHVFPHPIGGLGAYPAGSAISVSRIGNQRSPFGVAAPKAGNWSRFRLRLATMRPMGGFRWANLLERRSGPRSGLSGESAVALL